MSSSMPVRLWLTAACTVALLAAGAASVAAPPPKEKVGGDKLETTLIGEYTTFQGYGPVVLTGVGLVVDLPGTGGDPAPSKYRTMLLEELKRRDIPNPNKILASPNTALVVVQTYLPPLLEPGEKLDVEVIAPESANVKSLAGGWLMECFLTEQTLVPGQGLMKGHTYARAKGPVLAAGITSPDTQAAASLMQRGRVLAGGTLTKGRELAINLRSDSRSVRNSSRIANAVGTRFHDYDKYGIKKPMAVAKTDARITLELHPRYKDNYPRYLDVIKHISFKDSPVAQRVRMQKLQEELFEPELCEEAALQLEAIGNASIPPLKAALKAPTLECQFQSAMALAYLGDASGVAVLAQAAREEPAFRVFALAALSTIDDADAHMALRELMSQNSEELRYGAFRALWTLDRKDPFIRGEPMLEPLDPALADDVNAQKERIMHFVLHVLATGGDPMVHVTLRTRPEVVIFGAEQEFATPLMLAAGRSIMLTAQPGSETVTIVRFEPNQPDQRKEVSLKVADVIRAAVDLGARYPDIVQMLAEASRQHNLPTRLATDSLPKAGRIYNRPQNADAKGPLDKPAKPTRIGRDLMAPNMFPIDFEASGEEGEGGGARGDGEAVQASVPAAVDKDKSAKSEPKASASAEKSSPAPADRNDDENGRKKPFGLINRLRAER